MNHFKTSYAFSVKSPAFWLGILLLLALLCSPSWAKLVEESTRIPVKVTDVWRKTHAANVFTFIVHDDAVASPKPIALLLHGRSSDARVRSEMDVSKSHIGTARWLARNGFFVVSYARIGYGQTGGEDIDDTGSCRDKRYFEPYESAVSQSMQVLQAMRQRPDVAQDRGIVIGQSYGGLTAVGVAARNLSGIQAVFNFAGGGGGNPDKFPGNPCRSDLLKKNVCRLWQNSACAHVMGLYRK